MESNHLNCKQPARAIPPHLRLLNAVAHLETPDSPDPMNSSTTGTSSAFSEVKPFRAPTRAFGSPYKSSSKTFKSPHGEVEVVQSLRRKKQKQKNVRLNCPLPAPPISDSELDSLVREMGRLTLTDGPTQASLPADDGFNISTAAAPHRTSSIFNASLIDSKVGQEKEDAAVVSGHGLHSGSPRRPDDTPLGNLVSTRSPPFRPIHTTPVRPSSIPTATTASATDTPSASRPRLTAIAVSLVYEVFASPDDEADEMQTWYPIGGGALNVAATGRGLTLGATVEV